MDTIVASLQDRVDQARLRAEHGDLRMPFDPPSAATTEHVPIRDVQNMTSGRTGTWILLPLHQNVDLIDAADWARSVWPVTVYADCVTDEEVFDRFALWRSADHSGVRALDELLRPLDTSED
ncbi:MAG: hypothetical protein ABI112_16805 [Terracoccus sp.]